MICKVCNIDNSEDSKFCVECGIGFNNGKEQKRVVSAEEMKNLLWSIDWEKIRNGSEKKRLIGQIQAMMKIWQNDPSYIPVIMAPRRNDGGFIQVPKDIDMEKFKKELEKQQAFDAMIGPDAPLLSTIKSGDISSGGELNNEGLLQKYTVEERLKKNYYDATRDNIPCGVCGDMRCNIKHIPPIQQQYQEAFENVQRIRRFRLEKWAGEQPLPSNPNITIKEAVRISDIGVDSTARADGRPESKIIERDVRKGIPPRRPEPELTGIRK